MLRREVAAHADADATAFEPAVPEQAARTTPPIIWIIMSSVGGLIAVLALFTLLNNRADAPNAGGETASAPDRVRGAAADRRARPTPRHRNGAACRHAGRADTRSLAGFAWRPRRGRRPSRRRLLPHHRRRAPGTAAAAAARARCVSRGERHRRCRRPRRAGTGPAPGRDRR